MSDYSDFFAVDQRNAASNAVFSLEDDPEKAARAQKFAEATGDDPALVYSNLDHYEAQHKAAVVQGFFDTNAFLRDYANSHPLAAKVSNDDWGQMDTYSNNLQKVSTLGLLKAGIEGFKSAFEGQGEEIGKFSDWALQQPVLGNTFVRSAATAGAVGIDTFMRTISGVMQGGAGIVGEGYKQLGGNEAWAGRLTRDLVQAAQVAVPEVAPEAVVAHRWMAHFDRVMTPYIADGKVPPVGLHPAIDEAHKTQAEMDKEALSGALKAATETQTRERSPELLKLFTELHNLPDTVGISSDAVRALYGDKVPVSDDGVLGWVPKIDEQLQTAAQSGGDIQVPLADWLTKVDPQIAKALEDHIRVRPEGMTVEEAKKPINYQPEGTAEVPGQEAVDALRQSVGIKDLQPTPESTQKARQLSLNLPDTTPMNEREEFASAAAIGMNVKQYRLYKSLIEERAAGDIKAAEERAIAAERKRQTDEWKTNRQELRAKVADDITDSPTHELDEALREGRIKLRADGLTEEQKAALPPKFVGDRGLHPDDISSVYGVDNGRSVVDSIIALNQDRLASGMKPHVYRRRLIDLETDKQMEAKYGDLDKNIIEEAKEQVLSVAQEDILHQETLAAASQAGLEFPIKKEEYLGQVLKDFNNLPMRNVSSDSFLADAGRAIREVETALLKGDYAEAFRQKQRQYNALIFAREAKKIEKVKDQFDTFAKRFANRELPSVHQEYTNWIHDLLLRTGQRVKRSIQDLQESLDHGGDSGTKTLADFVEYKERHDLREVPVAEFLQDPRFKSTIDDLTADQFRQLNDSLKALAKNGRDEKKLLKAGEEADLNEIKGQLREGIQQFDPKEYNIESGQREQRLPNTRALARYFGVAHMQVEALLNSLDKFNDKGPWNQYLFRPLVEGANHAARLEREFAEKLGKIADNADLTEQIPNSPFKNPFDPIATEAAPKTMTRKGLRAVMLNMGNDSNLNKMIAGYFKPSDMALEKAERKAELTQHKANVIAWVHTNATKADWDWTQKIWDLLEELHQQSNTMYRGLSGIEPESLVINPIQTPHGEYAGGYYPLIRHPIFGEDPKFNKADLEGQGFVRATTPAGYTKARTGAIYPISLNLDMLPNRIKQIIHDVALRPAVINASKILSDKEIMNDMKKHLGNEWADMFQPWLKDVANASNDYNGSKAMAELSKWSDFARQNVITTLVGLNPSTVLKHGPTAMLSSMAEVGPVNFLKAVTQLLSVNDETSERNWQFATRNSEELQRRARNWLETMGGGHAQLEGRTALKAIRQGDYGAAFMSLRETITELASKPVAISDLVSAVPTWMAKYESEMADHGVHGDAVYSADKAVRQAHGSSAITSKSAVARSRGLSWFTGFFTFFNDLLNRQAETIWRAGMAVDLAKEGNYGEAMSQAKTVIGRTLAYAIGPAIIEELVSPLPSDDKESWGKKAAKGLLFTGASSWIGSRDIVSGVLNGRDPSAGLLSTLFKSGSDVFRDLNARNVKPENIIKHGAQLGGILTGMVPAQVGRTAEFGYKVDTGQEKPKGPWGWLVGGRYGTLKHHEPTLEKYLGHLIGH